MGVIASRSLLLSASLRGPNLLYMHNQTAMSSEDSFAPLPIESTDYAKTAPKLPRKLISNEKLFKLKQAWRWGADDASACLHAEISSSTLYRYMQAFPMLRELRNLWRANPVLNAVKNVNGAVEKGDLNTSKWLLERRARNEYGNNQQIQIDAQVSGVIGHMDIGKLKALIADTPEAETVESE